jgi:peptide/nickel transport system permease protein
VSPVLKLLTQRLALGLLLLFLVSILIFAGTIILPGDVAQSILGQSATPEALANLRRDLGLNDPPIQRYFAWLGGAMTGDLGTALTSGLDISGEIGKRLGNTLFLAFWAAIIAVPLSIFLGLLAVRYRDRWPDKLISAVTLSTISVPEFLIGYLLMFFIGVKLRWFPSTAVSYRPDADLFTKLESIALPVAVLTLVVLAHMMRMTRAAILNVMQSA